MAKKASRGEQQWIDGTAPPHHKDVSDAATALVNAKEDAESAGAEVKRRHAALLERMKKHNLPSYIDRGIGLRVVRDTKDTVKVKKLGKVGADK